MTTTSATGNSRAAFTLIELSIAVFIIATLLAVTAPYFVRSFNAASVSAAARTFATTCQFARAQAVLRQKPAMIEIDLDRQMFWVGQVLTNDSGEETAQVLKSTAMPVRVRLFSAQRADEQLATNGRVEMTFYPNGTCDAVTVAFRGNERGSGVAVQVDPVTARGTTVPAAI
jgi:prepilin-type N-terminal cleavage/methylation domain-containing protein